MLLRKIIRGGTGAYNERGMFFLKNLFAILTLSVCPCAAMGELIREQEIEQIRTELSKVEKAYQNYQAEIQIVTFPGNQRDEQNNGFASRGPWFRWDSSKGILIVTPDRAVSVRQSTADKAKYLVNRVRTSKTEIESEIERMRLGVKLPFAPTSYMELSLADLLVSNEIELVDIATTELGSEKVRVVEAVSSLNPNLKLRMRWYFRLGTPMMLIRHEITNDEIPGVKRVLEIAYGPDVSGVPFPERVHSGVYKDGVEASKDFEATLLKMTLKAPSKSFFMLEQFGLNDQLGRADRNDWAIGIGFLGIVLVVYGLNRYFKRQRV